MKAVIGTHECNQFPQSFCDDSVSLRHCEKSTLQHILIADSNVTIAKELFDDGPVAAIVDE